MQRIWNFVIFSCTKLIAGVKIHIYANSAYPSPGVHNILLYNTNEWIALCLIYGHIEMHATRFKVVLFHCTLAALRRLEDHGSLLPCQGWKGLFLAFGTQFFTSVLQFPFLVTTPCSSLSIPSTHNCMCLKMFLHVISYCVVLYISLLFYALVPIVRAEKTCSLTLDQDSIAEEGTYIPQKKK